MAKKKIPSEEVETMNDDKTYDDDEKPNFEDPEDFVDDVDDEGEKPVEVLCTLTRGFEFFLTIIFSYLFFSLLLIIIKKSFSLFLQITRM